MYGLNIHFKSIQLDKILTHKKDKIRVTVSSYPNHSSKSFTMKAKKLNNCDKSSTIIISEQTKGVLFLFEKKGAFQLDMTLATTVISPNEFPKSIDDITNTEVKTFNVYEPLQDSRDDIPNQNRQIYGKIIVQFTTKNLTHSKTNKIEINHGKFHRGKTYSKMHYHFYNNENRNISQDVFINNQ